MTFNYKMIIGMLITILMLVFITVKMDCETLEKEIISLSKQKQIIKDHIHSLRMQEYELISRKRIERIANEHLGMHSPMPESLVVFLK